MNMHLKVSCCHVDLEKNVECDQIERAHYYPGKIVYCYMCPICKKETVITLAFLEDKKA